MIEEKQHKEYMKEPCMSLCRKFLGCLSTTPTTNCNVNSSRFQFSECEREDVLVTFYVIIPSLFLFEQLLTLL